MDFLECGEGAAASDERCDGKTDCDGLVDEGNPDGGAKCETGLLGICNGGQQACGRWGPGLPRKRCRRTKCAMV